MATALSSSTGDSKIESHAGVDSFFNISRRTSHVLPMVPSSPLLAEHQRRSVTLGRGDNTSIQPKISRPSDFTRVRRMNTFKCVVKKPSHPPLKAKALSLNAGMKFGRSDTNELNKLFLVPDESVSKDESSVFGLPEVQEVILTFTAAPLSSTSTMSTSSEVSCQEEALPIVSTPTLAGPTCSISSKGCPICKEEVSPHAALVIFGNATLHLKCFRCGRCHQPMGAIKEFLVQTDGTPLCGSCTPSCHICHDKIYHNHVAVLKKNFHEECLACSRCRKKFNLLTKVYANNGEPCCAGCITPVFNEIWSPTKIRTTSRHSHSSLLTTRRTSTGSNKRVTMTLSPSPSTDSGVSDSASNDGLSEQIQHGVGNCDLNPRLESLSRSIASYSSNCTLRMKTSSSAPNLSECSVTNLQRLSLSSLKDILYDEAGSLLFLCHCVSQCMVELIAFWLDVEHFKHFDGGDEDLKLFGHHIVLKYIGYFAEIPVPLPKDIQNDIFETMEPNVSQSMFNEAQQYILRHMERELLPGFLNSREGKNYIESVVDRELLRMKKKTPNSSAENLTANVTRARVTKFDKRYMETKYYVYEVEVQYVDGSTYTIYRRYSEWYSLNQRLRKAFPKDSFPRLPKKIFLRRSQVRAVAEERMKQLQFYLQGLSVLRPEVLNCKILGDFLTQTEMDKEDEQFNKRITALQRKKSS